VNAAKNSPVKPLPASPPGYRLIRPIGSGALKEVFEGAHIQTNEKVALKRYKSGRDNWIDPRDLTINFLDVKFHHRNLIPAHRIAGAWIAEPLLESVLSKYLSSGDRLSVKEVLTIAGGLLEGLVFLHEVGLVHGDIKPQNMGIQSNVPLICDFGTASILNQRRGEHNYPGTIRTRPPELHARGVSPTALSDVWMMGASILALITGDYPFVNEEQVLKDPTRRLAKGRTLRGIRRGETVLHNRIVGSVQPRWLALLLCHALRFDPSKRLTLEGVSEMHPRASFGAQKAS